MEADIAIVGGGLAGGGLACALAGSGLRLALIEPKPVKPLPATGFDTRVYALSGHSRRFLERHGIWQRIVTGRVAPVREMLVFGDDGSAKLEFNAYRCGVPELAVIVEEANLRQAVADVLASQENLSMLNGVECGQIHWRDSFVDLTLSTGEHIEAALVIAADGAESKLRSAAGITPAVQEYGQQGVVANFHAERPHRDVARQWFRRDGVLALLPLPDDQVSMVWSTADAHADELLVMDAEELGDAVRRASEGAVGRLRLAGAVRAFPLRRMHARKLIAPRLALLGDAAHNVHPLAGQGLNLGFGDTEALAQVLADRGLESDCGSVSLLRRYERSRKEDILAMELVTGGLHALFGSRVPGIPRLRNAGLKMTDRIPPLKRFLVKRALG